jgi:hypothetical protein
MQQVVIVQQPDGTYVKQVIDVDVNVNAPVFAPPAAPIAQQVPLPPPQPGPIQVAKGVLNGDMRCNPATRQYEYVQLARPPRTGLAKRLFGV